MIERKKMKIVRNVKNVKRSEKKDVDVEDKHRRSL